MNSVPSSVTKIVTLTLQSANGTFVVGESVVQSNGSSNTANGIVLGSNSSINTLTLFNTTGNFVVGSIVTGNTSQATANIASVNIQV